MGFLNLSTTNIWNRTVLCGGGFSVSCEVSVRLQMAPHPPDAPALVIAACSKMAESSLVENHWLRGFVEGWGVVVSPKSRTCYSGHYPALSGFSIPTRTTLHNGVKAIFCAKSPSEDSLLLQLLGYKWL